MQNYPPTDERANWLNDAVSRAHNLNLYDDFRLLDAAGAFEEALYNALIADLMREGVVFPR